MKKAVVAALMAGFAQASIAQADVYLCPNPNAPSGKEYKNTGEVKGCKKVELPSLTNNLPSSNKKKGGVEIGMTRAEARKSQGKPASVRQIQTRNGLVERWTYSDGSVLTFANGILEVIEK